MSWTEPSTSHTAEDMEEQELQTGGVRGKCWAVTITTGTCTEGLTDGFLTPVPSGHILIGVKEAADGKTSQPHYHLLYKGKKTVRKNFVVQEALDALQCQIHKDRQITYANTARVQEAYIQYMFKNNKSLLDQAFHSLKTAGLRVTCSTASKEDATTYHQADPISEDLKSGKRQWLAGAPSPSVKPTHAQWFVQMAKQKGTYWATRHQKVLNNYLDHWNEIDDDDDSAMDAKKRKIQEENSTKVSAILSRLDVIYPDDKIMTAVDKWLKSCKFKFPIDITPSGHLEMRAIVLCTMALMANVSRPAGSNIKQLWFSGPSGTGKTALTYLVAGPDDRIKLLTGDAMGVGRYRVSKDQQVLVFDEATLKQVSSDQNLRTLNSMADGYKTSVKVHSTSVTVDPIWIIINGNVNLKDFTMEDQTQRSTDADKPHSMRRRYIECHTDRLLPEEDGKIMHSNNSRKAAGACILRIALYYATKKQEYGTYANSLIEAVEQIKL